MSGSMEMDPPHESDGSTNGSKENDSYTVSEFDSGLGLPYAPEDFPNPGDKWGWKVGKRITSSGHFADRYLNLPDRLYKEMKSTGPTCTRGFASKLAVGRFLLEAFPGTDINKFFASFTWRIPSEKIKENNDTVTDIISDQAPKFDPAGCKAGNINCSSLLQTNHLNTITCDICCIEPLFCQNCCCILCSKSLNGDQTFIKCEAIVKDGLICGHICHIECGLRSYMAGTVGGTIGLDAEYYCRRCDAITDLIPVVKKLFKSCESIGFRDKIHKILYLCVIMLRGSNKPTAKALSLHVQSALVELKEGNSNEDIWKWEDTSALTTGDLSQCEADTLEVSNFEEPSQRGTTSPEIQFSNFDYRLESIQLEQRVEKTLNSLKKSQETEYRIAQDVLTTQKNYLLDLYQELDKEKRKLATDHSLVQAVFKRMDQIKSEFEKIVAMQGVSKGFGKTSKHVLKEHFGVQAIDN